MATGDGKTQGDASTSPFGNGSGQVPGAGTMAGNDFVKNPAGGTSGGAGANFVTTPQGAGPTGATPTDFTKGGKSPQKSGEAPDLNSQSEIRDQGKLVPLADVPQGSPRKSLIGTGSMGDSRKPFKGI